MKRLIAVLLCLCLSAAWLPMGTAAAESEPATIEEQIRAFADSIDQANADDSAALALAVHGIGGGGKKLTMNASSPMAAALLNSELVQTGMAVIFTDVIETMQRLDQNAVPGMEMSFGWYGADSDYGAYILTGTGEYPDNLDWMVTSEEFTGSLNTYDNSLEWMVGTCSVSTVIECIEDSTSAKTYQLTVTFKDRFDFSTANSAGFKKFLSAIGMLLFKEFDWTCTVTMQITAPYSYDHCSHSSGAYQWIYNGENRAMTSVGSDTYFVNNTTHRSKTAKDGTVHHYYELSNTIRLEHDKPWVLEYDVRTPVRIVFAPVDNAVTKTHPQIVQSARTSIFAVSKDYAMAENQNGQLDRYYAYNYYGTNLQALYPFAYDQTYTFRLENEVNTDGSNRICLSAIETRTGKVCLERIPMDDYYYHGGWMDDTPLLSTESGWLNSRDIHINYFGTGISGFDADTFELRLWENGEDGESVSYYERSTVTAPTCTKRGYTTYTCSACGHSKKADYVDTTGHSWGEWERISETHRQRTCNVCGEAEQEEIAVLYGDANSDGSVNALDLILLRQNLAGWDVEADRNAADANGDGSVNALDLILLRQYLAGWDVTLGP